MRSVILCGVLWFGCGDGSGSTGDDAGPDASLTVTDSEGASVSSITLAQTLVGQDSSGQLRVANRGARTTGPLAISISGDAANDFAIDNARTTCAAKALGAGESCDIVVLFRPTAVGERVAALVVASTPGGMSTVSMTGHAVMPDLHFNPSSLSFGQIEIGGSGQTTIELRNDGSAPASIDDITVTGAGFTKGFTTCGTTLAANSSCDITVQATPQALGSVTGGLMVTSNGAGYTAGLAARGARKVTVTYDGTGTGTIASSPAGIDCGATCSALFEGPVVLTAVPGASTAIAGWSIPACGPSTTCTVPTDVTPITVNVSFALTGSAMVNLAFSGNGTGEVQVVKNGTSVVATCFASCPVPANPGDQLSLRAATFSDYGGFSGGCTSTTAECSFTVQPGTTTVNVGFSKSAKEQWTRLLPGDPPKAAAFDGSGNLIVAGSNKLTKLGPTGSTIWTLDLAVGAVETGPGDTIYTTTGGQLRKLDANGNELWSQPAAGGSGGQCHGIAVGADGAVAVRDGNSVARWTSTGATSWTKTFTGSAGRCSVAIDASGNVLVDIENQNLDATDRIGFDPTGTSLGAPIKVTNQYTSMLSSSPTGSVVACSTGHGRAHLNLASPTIVISSPAASPNYCSYAGSDIAWLIWDDDTGLIRPAKWSTRRVASGTATWVLARDVLRAGLEEYGTAPMAIAGSTTGRIAIVGRYWGVTVDSAWVQVFDP